MPGILPMKVIKVGPSSQSRIAQACDRCRSKKIRCDGIRPCCSQCANVGFECKTSDKLSRRAFPRGYTESLEERVRSLETEVKELKDLLDEKDEKIDMLSKMHANRKPCTPSSSPSPPADNARDSVAIPPKDDVFRVQASPLLLGADNSDSYFMGASSGRAFVDAFKRRIQEDGKSLAGFNTGAFLNIQGGSVASLPPLPGTSTAPPHMFADRCVNVFFQEWAPLFPVLHKPTFLCMYEEFMSNPDQMTDHLKLAQLHLVFGIAGLSSAMPEHEQTTLCESQWRSSLEAILMDNTLGTLQCLVLAIIHCIAKADYGRLQHYKGIAVALSHRLGLHQSQKRFSFGVLTTETRKKVFWTLYTVDCFSASLLGLPKLLKEEDIHTEYPSDTDDEYVTEKGFQPTLPGECTKISSALALFRVSRILSKALDQIYPSAATHDLSMQCLTTLEAELNGWSDNLPAHLKLTFVLDKPSTDITGSRSALLSLAYYYIRTLIYRPAVGSSLGNKSSPSVISLADSSKHIIQIVQLLEERSMSFSFCLNKNEMLTLCGLSLLYHGLDLKQEGKLMQEGNRMVAVVIKFLTSAKAPGATDFKRLAASMINVDAQPKLPNNGRTTDISMPAPPVTKPAMSTLPNTKSNTSPTIHQKQMHSQVRRYTSATMSESDILSQQEKLRRVTLPHAANQHSETAMGNHEFRGSPAQLRAMIKHRAGQNPKLPNLDYLSLSSTPTPSQPESPSQTRTGQVTQSSNGSAVPTSAYTGPKTTAESTEWEVLVGSFDDRNLYDAIYGGGPGSAQMPAATGAPNYGSWSPESWDYSSAPMGDFLNATTSQSVLSLSDESLSSGGEEVSTTELGLSDQQFDYKDPFLSGPMMSGDAFRFLYDGSDGNFGM